ncbi:MAG: hypothetical protein WCK89_06345 [bacterium]
MDNRTLCPICRTSNVARAGVGANTSEIHCPRCGRFQIQTLAETQLMNSPPAFPPQHLLSGLCRNMWEILGEKPLITVDLFKSWTDLDKVAKIAVPRDNDLVTKSEYLLKYLRRHSKTIAEVVTLSPSELAVGFCANKNELLFCLRYLADKGQIEEEAVAPRKGQSGGGLAYRLTSAGWAALDAATPPAQPLAVVALAQDKDPDTLWTQGFSAGIQAAGFTAVRIENKEYGNKITHELIVDLRRSTFLVADLTGQSPLAAFEAGLALGLGKPVFWTCEESEARDKKLLIETRQYVVTPWMRDKPDDFARRLAKRIEATLGRP